MRGQALVVVGALALAGCGEETGSGTQTTGAVVGSLDAALMSGMILHLPDGPEGATIGDDSHCGGGLGTEGDSDAFLDLVVEVDGLYIRVNPAFCYNCLSPPTPELPFRTPDGLRTIVAALEPFER